jgi:putative heme-binding domain-containing protein
VHLLAPGFTVRELPVHLTNLNGLAYAPDGRLFALGYDGRIHVLRDTDGDGLEDTVEEFWYQPTLRTPISLAWRPEGLYVVSNGKVSLFHDPGKGPAQREEVIVHGWVKDDGTTGGAVDALGFAFDRDGALYFGIGCADYSNAYRLRDGIAHYDRHSERGTILKVSPDRKERHIVSTGIRFPYAIAFNRQGDLFCTDQEGETWLPGGNPLDELNHILPGRHYGFPPRHLKYLPDVHDEPPVVAFGPQHQSSCGMKFNEARPGQPAFGPAAWEGAALVAGWSRGKIWRVRLVKTPAGYVGRATQIAALGMLTLDLAISPRGDLVVCCHSGAPDWGTGPSGPGKIFKISYTDRSAPQPVAAWAAGPMDVRVAFDRPVPPDFLNIPAATAIRYGEHVREGDRFETFRPGYASVEKQQQAFRGQIHIAAAKLSPDRRTLLLTTDPHPVQATYALTLPVRGRAETAYDLAYDLNGVEARWTSEDGSGATWSGWLPHLDLTVARGLTAGSAEHARLERLLAQPSRLRLQTRLTPPANQLVLRLAANAPFTVEHTGGERGVSMPRLKHRRLDSPRPPASGPATEEAIVTLSGDADLSVTVRTGLTGQPLELHTSYHTAADPTERPLPLAWHHLPWAHGTPPASATATAPSPELAGGDWKRGEAIFFGKEANCSACHTLRGKGGKVGPDLSNLVSRDAGSVLRDIVQPSAALNPDYVPYVVLLKDDRLFTGLLRAEGDDRVRLVDSSAHETMLVRRDIAAFHASTISIMPQGYAELLGGDRLKDLLVFLTTASPPDNPQPPARSRAEVEAVLRETASPAPEKLRPLHIILVAGPKDHGPGEHDYPPWQRRWNELLGKDPSVRVETAWEWPSAAQWQSADLVVLYFWNHAWTDARFHDLDTYLARGGGLVALHSAVIHDKDPESLAQYLGLAAQPNRVKYRHGPLDLVIVGDSPLTHGLTRVHFVDETYWPLVGDVGRVTVLATAEEEAKARPMLWTYRRGKGRVFCSILGHYSWTFDDPLNRVLLLRGLAWAANEPVNRFISLAADGVTFKNGD